VRRYCKLTQRDCAGIGISPGKAPAGGVNERRSTAQDNVVVEQENRAGKGPETTGGERRKGNRKEACLNGSTTTLRGPREYFLGDTGFIK